MDNHNRIIEILSGLSAATDIKDDDSLKFDLGIDSLGLVMLLIQIEDSFGIQLKESDMNPLELKTVGDVYLLVCGYLSEK